MNIALLTAAGSGTRTHQDLPKQFIHVNNKPIIIYTLEAFQKHPNIDVIEVVILKGWTEVLWAYAKQFNITKLKHVVEGGSTGQESIYNGLKEIEKYYDEQDVVMIHDGNRPLVSQDIITDSLVTYQEHGCAVAAIPCTEVVFISEGREASNTSIPRENLLRTQTPHTYKLKDILNVHKDAKQIGISNTAASCSLFEKVGIKSYFSLGSEKNLKITTVEDIEIFKALLSANNDEWIK